MKKILILLSLLAWSKAVEGQMMVNGDFSVNYGNAVSGICTLPASWGGSTFMGPIIVPFPNWDKTHGQPSFVTGWAGNCIHMWDKGGKGGGIRGLYNFHAGQYYNIHLCVAHIVNPSHIRLVAGKYPVPLASGACLTIDCGPYESHDPSSTAVDADCPFPPVIPSGTTSMEEIAHAPLNTGDNSILYTPSGDFDWIAIFPYDRDDCFAEIVLRACWVGPECRTSVPFSIPYDVLPSPIVPLNTGLYTNADVINVNPDVPHPIISVVPSGITTFQAANEINFGNLSSFSGAFLATPGTGYFLAEIKDNCPWNNMITCWADKPGSGVGSGYSLDSVKPNLLVYKMGDGNQEQAIGTVSILPNPAKDFTTINFIGTSSGDLAIEITDASGRAWKKESVQYEKGRNLKHAVDVSNFTPGVYFISLTLNGERRVEKIVKL